MQFALAEGREIAVVAKGTGKQINTETSALRNLIWSKWRPFDVAAIASFPPTPGSPALLAERPLKEGQTTVYVCRNFACELPVNTPEELGKLLGQA
jgi:hypothetical protein